MVVLKAPRSFLERTLWPQFVEIDTALTAYLDAAAAATLGRALHPRTAAYLADLVRMMNCYYSNLIEGHDTRPRKIERAMSGDLDADEGRRNLQREAVAHIRVQAEIDRSLVERSDKLKPEAGRLLTEALVRGEIERGEAARITGLPERTARRPE